MIPCEKHKAICFYFKLKISSSENEAPSLEHSFPPSTSDSPV